MFSLKVPSERNQTKLDKKYKGTYAITSVLDNDRYELRSITDSHRTLKYAHENLRLVPRGHEGLLEITARLANEETVTAASEDDVGAQLSSSNKDKND